MNKLNVLSWIFALLSVSIIVLVSLASYFSAPGPNTYELILFYLPAVLFFILGFIYKQKSQKSK